MAKAKEFTVTIADKPGVLGKCFLTLAKRGVKRPRVSIVCGGGREPGAIPRGRYGQRQGGVGKKYEPFVQASQRSALSLMLSCAIPAEPFR